MKSFYILISFMLLFSAATFGQIEGTYINLKDFHAFGFGAFLNFAIPKGESDYVTIEGGILYFKDKNKDEDLGIFPVKIGYRYTLDRSGTGFWVEPQAGYAFGGTSIPIFDQYGGPVYDNNGNQENVKVAGPMAGVGFGYLFQQSGRLQFNIGVNYEHTFGNTGTNIFALRISHAFNLGRRQDD